MALIEGGSNTANVANVNATYQLQVGLNADSTKNGLLAIAGRADTGKFTGSVRDVALDVDIEARARIAADSIIFEDSFAGSVQNTDKWIAGFSSMTMGVSNGVVTINAGSATTASAVGAFTSYATVPTGNSAIATTTFTQDVMLSQVGVLNTTAEFCGAFIASGTSAPTDGVFLRFNASGELRIVSNFNGTETQSSAITYTNTPTGWTSALVAANVMRRYSLVVSSGRMELWIGNESGDIVLAGYLNKPVAVPSFCSVPSLPLKIRLYNSASPPSVATKLLFGYTVVTLGGLSNSLPYADANAISAGSSTQGQTGGAPGSTANMVNSTVPATATLSNTTAGYSTLGGRFLFAAPAGAETDYVLFAYQLPAATNGFSGRGILIRGVTVHTVNIGATVTTTAHVLEWFLGYGCTAASLATAEAANTKAPREIYVGTQAFVIGAGPGTQAAAVSVDLSRSPVYAPAGSFIQIGVRIPIGTATGSQKFRGGVTVVGDWF